MANANNLKFLVCCANGSGSSLMAQLALDKVLKRNGINFASMFTDAEAKGVKVIPLKNVMSDKEIEEKLKAQGIIE